MVITDDDLKFFRGKMCRCGCGQPATYLTLSADIGEQYPTLEAACSQASQYLSEACAEIDAPFLSRELYTPPAPAAAQDGG